MADTIIFLTFEDVAKFFGVSSRSFVYDRIDEGTLPQPIEVGNRAIRFLKTEIDAIAKARIAGKSKDDIQALVNTLHAKRLFFDKSEITDEQILTALNQCAMKQQSALGFPKPTAILEMARAIERVLK